MQLVFELAILDYDVVELRWPIAFGKIWSAPYQALAEALEPVPGVNRVEVLRYSAHIDIAPHVDNLGDVLQDIQAHLLDDANLARELAAVGVTNYGVTINPDVVTRRPAP